LLKNARRRRLVHRNDEGVRAAVQKELIDGSGEIAEGAWLFRAIVSVGEGGAPYKPAEIALVIGKAENFDWNAEIFRVCFKWMRITNKNSYIRWR
jgi:hypothetical protein